MITDRWAYFGGNESPGDCFEIPLGRYPEPWNAEHLPSPTQPSLAAHGAPLATKASFSRKFAELCFGILKSSNVKAELARVLNERPQLSIDLDFDLED